MERSKKEQIVAELHQKLGKASAAILTDYKGLTVAEITSLRDSLAVERIDYQVVKNTLMRLACKQTDASVLEPLLTGTCAVQSRSATRPFRPRSSRNSARATKS